MRTRAKGRYLSEHQCLQLAHRKKRRGTIASPYQKPSIEAGPDPPSIYLPIQLYHHSPHVRGLDKGALIVHVIVAEPICKPSQTYLMPEGSVPIGG